MQKMTERERSELCVISTTFTYGDDFGSVAQYKVTERNLTTLELK